MNKSLCRKQIRPAIAIKYKQLLGAYILIALLVVPQAAASAMGGAMAGDGMPPRKKKSEKAKKTEDCAVCEKLEALEQKVKELSQQLEATAAKPVEDADARREINELKAQLKIAEDRAAAAERANEQLRAETNTVKASVKATDTAVASVAATQTATAAQIEELSKKTSKAEADVARIGPFRFSGDFRLRGDAILRSSLANPGPGQTMLQHVQNLRARYRLRFNLATDINPWVSFHGQLSTGPANNQLTLDQDFTSTTARHPFFISEAYIDVHPTKWFSIQGGRLPEVFADNSRFLFDDDIRVNGFNEKFVKTFREPIAGFRSIEFRAGQYILTNPNVAIVSNGNLGPTGALSIVRGVRRTSSTRACSSTRISPARSRISSAGTSRSIAIRIRSSLLRRLTERRSWSIPDWGLRSPAHCPAPATPRRT